MTKRTHFQPSIGGNFKKDVKYDKTNPIARSVEGPWSIYEPWRICRNAVKHNHMQRKDGFPTTAFGNDKIYACARQIRLSAV